MVASLPQSAFGFTGKAVAPALRGRPEGCHGFQLQHRHRLRSAAVELKGALAEIWDRLEMREAA